MSGGLRAWDRRTSLVLACVGAGLMALGALTSTAYAESPQRVGWWNEASGNGSAAPSPTTPAGGLRVAAGPVASAVPNVAPQGEQILAYGAVLFAVREGSAATLTLTVVGTAQGTPQVAACPTQNTTWTAGDDQPSSAEPAYDCAAQRYPGKVSPDGTTITFAVKALGETTPNLLSLAIVPDPSSTALPTGSSPFAVDIKPPDAGSLAVATTSPASSPPPPSTSQTGASYASSPAQPVPPIAAGNTGSAGGPLGSPAVRLPAPAPAAPPAPTVSAAAPTAPRSAAPAPPPTVAPTAAIPDSTARGRIASALGTVVLLAAVVVWSFGYGLLGGRVVPLSLPLTRRGGSR